MSATDLAGLGPGRQGDGWGRLSPRALDRLEQVALVALFAWLVWRLLPGSLRDAPPYLLVLIASEATVIVFALLRRPAGCLVVSPLDWMVAFAGTLTALLVENGSGTFMPGLGSMVMMAGLFVHTGAKLTLRRSFGVVAADRGLKTDGLYAIVRHPMYMGYLITHAGFMLAVPSLWNLAVYGVAWACLARRMAVEERVLSGNPAFAAYRAKVRWRLLPGIW